MNLTILWHDQKGGAFFPIAQLERCTVSPFYVFRYLPAFQDARERGLEPLPAFPDVAKLYRGDEVFSFFKNRVMCRSRSEYAEHIRNLDLDPETDDELAILGRSGGERSTDAFLLTPDPTPLETGRYTLRFWTRGAALLDGEPLRHLLSLEPGTVLELGDQGQISHGGFPVGRLPDHLRAFLLRRVSSEGNPSAGLQVRVLRRNPPISSRYMLLCELVFQWDGAAPRFAELGRLNEDPERVATRKPRPRAVVGVRLPYNLENLVVHLAEGNLPTAPTFARPTGGTLFGKQLTDQGMELEWLPDKCSLELTGASHEQYGSFLPVDLSRLHTAYVALEDGSEVYAEAIGSFGKGTRWRCQLAGWHWVSPAGDESVRYWVGFVEDSSIEYPWLNLAVATLNSEGLQGLHVDGSPSLTLLKLESPREADGHRSKLAVVVQSSNLEHDMDRALYAVTNMLAVTAGLTEPPLFYGYDEALNVRVCFSRGRLNGLRAKAWLPVLPLLEDAQRQNVLWPVPFLQCLRDKILGQPSLDDLHDALVWFRFVLEDPYWPGQVAKLGGAVRLLLRWSEGRSAADWLNLDAVNTMMERLAHRLKLALPATASEALSLAHKVALLGEHGIQPCSGDARSFFASGQFNEVAETLRVTFATLLAGAIGYYGPVVGQLQPIRSLSAPHEPWLALGEEGTRRRAQQTEAARAYYVAGVPTYPW